VDGIGNRIAPMIERNAFVFLMIRGEAGVGLESAGDVGAVVDIWSERATLADPGKAFPDGSDAPNTSKSIPEVRYI